MAKMFHLEESKVIDAKAEDLYAVVSDYHVGHPAIVPKPYFTSLEVEKGGKGDGTIVIAKMNVFGAKRTYRQFITEPEPGRVILESDPVAGVYTRFIFEPLNGGTQTRVTFSTDFTIPPGIMGWIESKVNPPIMRWLYQKELQNLADYVRDNHQIRGKA